jgi:hypothetical protein
MTYQESFWLPHEKLYVARYMKQDKSISWANASAANEPADPCPSSVHTGRTATASAV